MSSANSSWFIYDIMRGLTVQDGAPLVKLSADWNGAEVTEATTNNTVSITTDGFTQGNGYGPLNASSTGVYIAIRRPNKPPTAGTDVFKATKAAGNTDMTTNFPVDLLFNKSNYTGGTNNYVVDRVRGSRVTLLSDGNNTDYTGWTQDAFPLDNNSGVDAPYWGSGTDTWSTHLFRRAPGFLDIVTYTGTGSSSSNTGQQNITHNLGVVPELIIVKVRDALNDWVVYNAASGAGTNMRLNRTNADIADIYCWDNTTPTSSVFRVGSDLSAPTNTNTKKFIAHLRS